MPCRFAKEGGWAQLKLTNALKWTLLLFNDMQISGPVFSSLARMPGKTTGEGKGGGGGKQS